MLALYKSSELSNDVDGRRPKTATLNEVHALELALRIYEERGRPPADTSQPSFPIQAAFYYAWYPEAWFRDPVFPYSLFHPSLDYYSNADARVVRA